jgi:hypothetical protein
MDGVDRVFVVGDRLTGCPIGCGVEVVLVKCRGLGLIVGFCWACEVSQLVPLQADYQIEDRDIKRSIYAPHGLDLPSESEVRAAGLRPFVLEELPLTEWGGFVLPQ